MAEAEKQEGRHNIEILVQGAVEQRSESEESTGEVAEAVEEVVAEETPVEEVQAEVPDEAPAEEAPAEEVEKPAKEEPTHEDAKPVWTKEQQDQILGYANWGRNVDAALGEDADLRKAYFRHLQRKGVTLKAEWAKEIEDGKEASTQVQVQREVLPTQEEVLKKARQMTLEGKEAEASLLISEWHSKDSERRLQASLSQLQSKLDESEKQRKAREDADRHAMVSAQVKQQFVALVDQFPGLFTKDDKSSIGVNSSNNKFFERFLKATSTNPPDVPLNEIAEGVLLSLGMNKPKVQATQKKPAAKPAAPKMAGRDGVPSAAPANGSGKHRIEFFTQTR